MKKEDYFGKYFLREGDFKPEKIHDRTWREFGMTIDLCEKWIKKGVLFDSKEDAEVAQQNLISLAYGISHHTIIQEPRIMEAAVLPRIYISGPISGHDLEERRTAFKLVELDLQSKGYEVFNPMENGLPADATTSEHMRRDLNELTREDKPYDYICLMEKWNHSAGCWTEFHDALACGMKVIFVNQGDIYHFI